MRCRKAIIRRRRELLTWVEVAKKEGMSLASIRMYRESDEGKEFIAKVDKEISNEELYGRLP